MNKKDLLLVLTNILMLVLIIVGITIIIMLCRNVSVSYERGFRDGYVSALEDGVENRQFKYVLIKQRDGKHLWQPNPYYGKDRK